jgi:rhodanese-related sulfurtransferase
VYSAPRTSRTYTAGGREISLDEFRRHVENGSAVLVDARKPEQYASGHIRGAVNVPAGQMDAYMGRVLNTASPDQLVIIYCDGEWCESADMVSERLTANGFTNVRVYKPGWMVLSSSSNMVED